MSKVKKTRLRRLGVLAAGVCLTSVLLVSLSAPALAADPGSGSGPLPSGITPVVVLSGSDYNMGYQYSQQVIALCGPWFYQRTGGVYEPFSDTQIKALKAYQWYLKQYAPEMIDQIKGMADGATASGYPMTYTEALARQTGTRAFPGTEPPGSGGDTLPPTSMCSVWSAWGRTTTDGRLIGCDSFDAPAGFRVVTVAFPDVGNHYISGGGGAINNKGLWQGGSGGEGIRPIDRASGYDIPSAGKGQHLLRFSDTAEQALSFYLSWKMGLSENMTVGDANGGHFVVEYSPAFKVVRKPGDFGEGDFLTMRNNFFTEEGGKANLGDLPGKFYPHGGWALDPPAGMDGPIAAPGGLADIQMASARTNQTMYNMLSEYQGKVDLNFMKMMWRFVGTMPKDPWDTAEYRKTKARAWETPNNLDNCTVGIGVPDNGDQGKMYICTGPVGRVASPYEAGTDDDYYQIAGTHTFYELTLDSGPAATVADAEWAARHDTALAYQKLMYKNYGNVGFEGLNALFDEANTEYFQAANWVSRAKLATGNDKLLYYAQALTSYTRAQCHAEQVYEALVHPPVTPSDLGLKHYVAHSYGF